MRRRWLAALALLLLLGGCGRSAEVPETDPVPEGYPRSMTSVTYEEDAPQTVLDSRTVTYTYRTDDTGRITQRQYTLGGASYREQTTYDDTGHVVRVVSDRLEEGVPVAGSAAHTYTYDENGRRLTDETYAREGTAETLTARTAYVYGANARAESATITGADGTVIYTVTFTYTTPEAVASPADAVTGYDYAAAVLVEEMEVTGVDGTALQTARCMYDAADRPLYRETMTGDTAAWETYTYDAAGRLLTHTAHQDGMVYRETYEYA